MLGAGEIRGRGLFKEYGFKWAAAWWGWGDSKLARMLKIAFQMFRKFELIFVYGEPCSRVPLQYYYTKQHHLNSYQLSGYKVTSPLMDTIVDGSRGEVPGEKFKFSEHLERNS